MKQHIKLSPKTQKSLETLSPEKRSEVLDLAARKIAAGLARLRAIPLSKTKTPKT